MILQNELYDIIDRKCEDGEFVCSIKLNSESVIYKAHFPGNPITPGACMMQMLQEITENILGRKFELVKLSNVKFLMPLSPLQVHTLEVKGKYVDLDGILKVQAVFASEDVVYTKMSMSYRNI